MPYVYIANGVSRSDQTGSCYSRIGATCSISAYKPTSDIDKLLPPKVAATQHLWVDSKSLQFSDNAPAPAGYFGNALDSSLPQPPAPVNHTLINVRKKLDVDYKEFKARQAAGEIVTRPLGICTASAVAYPGLTTPLNNPTDVSFRRNQNGAFPVGSSIPCNRSGIVFPDNPNYVHSSSVEASLTNVRHKVKRYYVSTTTWKLPSVGECEAMAWQAYAALEYHDPDQGLVTSAIAEANNAGMDILTAIGELPETVKYIHQILISIIQLSRDTRREAQRLLRVLSTPKELADALASLWMQYRYAIMPLVYTYDDATKALSRDKAFEYITTRKKDTWDLELDIPGWTVTSLEVTDRVWLKRRYDTSLDLTFPTQVLVANLPQTIWELTKLSFVVDWAFNVGDFLASLQPPVGVSQQVTCYSTAVPENSRIDITSNTYPGMKVELYLGYYRTRPINPLAHFGLSANLRMTWKRSLDAACLLWGAFRNRKG